MGENGRSLSFYKGDVELRLPTYLSKSLIFSSASTDGAGWVTHTRIDGDPVIRGHDLCFDKTCQRNRLMMRAEAGCEKRFE